MLRLLLLQATPAAVPPARASYSMSTYLVILSSPIAPTGVGNNEGARRSDPARLMSPSPRTLRAPHPQGRGSSFVSKTLFYTPNGRNNCEQNTYLASISVQTNPWELGRLRSTLPFP